MRVAIIGSRGLTVSDLENYLPSGIYEIISGGAKGIDQCARSYALQNNIKLTEILPEYGRYGRAAPIIRNASIIDKADLVIAFWDGKSRGTKSAIDYAEKCGKSIRIEMMDGDARHCHKDR